MDKLWYNNEINSSHHGHSHQQAPIGWLSICSKMQRRDERMHDINVDSKHIKIFCVLLMVSSAILTFLGRGTFGLIQGLVGVIAGIEGYYGAMQYSLKNIKTVLIYLSLSSLFCIAMGVYSQYSADTYCEDPETEKQCRWVVLTWTILYLSIGLVFNVTMIIAVLRFYWKIRRIRAGREGQRGSLLD